MTFLHMEFPAFAPILVSKVSASILLYDPGRQTHDIETTQFLHGILNHTLDLLLGPNICEYLERFPLLAANLRSDTRKIGLVGQEDNVITFVCEPKSDTTANTLK
jgi:hypothetical protein